MNNNLTEDLKTANYALLFGGQATDWRKTLSELYTGNLKTLLDNVVRASDIVLENVSNEFITIHPRKINYFSDKAEISKKTDLYVDSNAFVSLPGILLAQIATFYTFLESSGADLNNITNVEGHSQGILAKEVVKSFTQNGLKVSEQLVQIVVIAKLIGAAASKVCNEKRITSSLQSTPMLSIRGLNRDLLLKVLENSQSNDIISNEVVIAAQNSHTSFILSGYSEDLQSVFKQLELLQKNSQNEFEKKLSGGSPLSLVMEFIDVTAPFHSPLLKGAVEIVKNWAAQIGIDVEMSANFAQKILVDEVNWIDSINATIVSNAKYIVDLGPGDVIYKISEYLVEGTGATQIKAGSLESISLLSTPGFKLSRTQNYSDFLPSYTTLGNGKTVVQTAFSRLTGRSPIMLAGMTPTTVEPEIVAAAANAGYWVEMAGGGQVTADVYNNNLTKLQSLLKPGRTVAFNSMFLDRYLWNLQFGGTKIVSKSRASGAPIDGVVITAGIPEFDEAVDLVKTLNSEGFPFVAFKPGTVKQIEDVLKIADATSEYSILIQVEDGHAGGHHSWENLDDLLITTYSDIRKRKNVVLCVGGGIGLPERAADYISGDWSLKYTNIKMPVDACLVGTAAMATKEAKTTPAVKKLLLNTPGISIDDNGGWVGTVQSKGGMTSSLSHLRADIYEIDNDSAAAARLILDVNDEPELLEKKRDEIIDALNKTAKPYFGDINEMTYYEMLERFAQLCFVESNIANNDAEESWIDRFYDLLQRTETRNCPEQNGHIDSLFPTVNDCVDYKNAISQVVNKYPDCKNNRVTPIDEAYFIEVCRKHPKPVPFVPRLDGELFKWWGSDSLWQSHDERYAASSCRIIPGPVSVAGIDRIDEPIADLLARFESAVLSRIKSDSKIKEVDSFARISNKTNENVEVQNSIEFIRSCRHISWTGHIIDNPSYFLEDNQYSIKNVGDNSFDIVIKLDTYWDNIQNPNQFHAVRELVIPVDITSDSYDGGVLVVNEERLPNSMFSMLATTAGKGSIMASGDKVEELPVMHEVDENNIGNIKWTVPKFGRAKFSFHAIENLGVEHKMVTGNALNSDFDCSNYVPDALLGTCWPPIYAALGSAMIKLGSNDNYPVIEGLLNAVHLDHTVDMVKNLDDCIGKKLNAYAWADSIKESISGRVVDVKVVVTIANDENTDDFSQTSTQSSSNQEEIAICFRERFAIQGRAYGNEIPEPPKDAGGKLFTNEIITTKRRLLRVAKVKAPEDMTPFARISGDYNPIHTSTNAARVAGLEGPIVHGMWLSAVSQHFVQAKFANQNNYRINGWTASWFSPTNLNDEVELTLERIGKIRGGGLILEVVAKINGNLAAKFTASCEPFKTAYCFPGQGIQHQGMGLDEIQISNAAKEVWNRADKHTKKVLGFSIINIVKNNPTQIIANGKKFFHPDGLLNLTQFTQVSLAVVGFAQTARLKESGSIVENGYFAGHSLGEYVALSSYGKVIPLETVIELVFARGSAMHSLVPRDKNGRSNYLMGALRPNQFGILDVDVKEYVNNVSHESGEFLEIVNYNLSGQQYAVAGTIKGLKALKRDADIRVKEFGGRGAFMYVPGIDVPFHSSVLRDGVPDFREKLMRLLPSKIDYDHLVGKYIPNLVARPFEFTVDFAKSILEVVPSTEIEDIIKNWNTYINDKEKLGRILLVELLCWQFASPVRWIETQDLLFKSSKLGIEHFVEIGLKNSPTLANMASKTLQLDEFSNENVVVYNIGRDESRVYLEDDDAAVIIEDDYEDLENDNADSVDNSRTINQTSNTEQDSQSANVQNTTPNTAQTASTGTASADDIPFKASDAINMLFAFSNKLSLDQIGPNDTAETLTNGVSSRRNQLLMDMSAELGLASIDSAAEAPVSALQITVDKMAPNYKAFGSVLGEIVRTNIRKMFGGAGSKQSKIQERVTTAWGLGSGWVDFVTCEIVLSTREGQSMRGGDLTKLQPTNLTNAKDVDALIDAAVLEIAQRRGVAVSLQGSTSGSGAMVDSEALDGLKDEILGNKGVLASQARNILKQLGLDQKVPFESNETLAQNQLIIDAVESELGADWHKRIAPAFSSERAVLFDDRFASAKEDLAHFYVNEDWSLSDNIKPNFAGCGENIANMASYYANKVAELGKNQLAQEFVNIAEESLTGALTETGSNNSLEIDFSNEIAVVTGAAPTSIAGAVVAKLLRGGATVIMTASNINSKRLDYAKKLYRTNASANASLWLVPANLSSYRDVDSLVEWIGTDQKETVGGSTKIIKSKMSPSLFFPFAAPSVSGTLADAGYEAEMETRLLLWSVERMIAKLSVIGEEENTNHKMHVVLPGSPNRGIFGGDGAYGEVKAAFDAIEKRWFAEKRWSHNVTIAHPKIGWVRGTSLMGGNDLMAPLVEEKGVKTYSTSEMADELIKLCSKDARESAKNAPISVDLTGGLGTTQFDLGALKKQAIASMNDTNPNTKSKITGDSISNLASTNKSIEALPSPSQISQPQFYANDWSDVNIPLEDLRVIVGIGEIGPWGSGRTRFEAEHGIQTDGSVELTPAGVLELAWMMDLVHWSESPNAGWYDQNDVLVPENEIFERFRDEVVARSGVREYADDDPAWIKDLSTQNDVSVFLDKDISFTVPTYDLALSFKDIDPEKTDIFEDEENSEWVVVKKAGAMTRVPRKVAMTRRVGGQIPTGFNPAKWGIPASMLESVDRLAIWNIVSTVDAFLSSGFSPAELLEAVHPSDVGLTQGTGIGGTDSMRKLFVDSFLGEDKPSDILQEALPNVIAAHVMQSYVGGYGVMVHPVGACATAAVSIEDAVDKIDCGKSDFVVAGAIDDISIESITGFGDMNATAKTADLWNKGIQSRFVSRANDRRRGGFVESEGGGTVLITRGDIAAKLGLPVFGVIAYARSFADGSHTSIPAPGLGALGAARGGKDSVLVKKLKAHGVCVDDVSVISKHDTSTNANDPNESELYTRLFEATGREEGNPLYVISQKTVTGHAKGGAAIFQISGLCQLFSSGIIPANRALDCVGSEFKSHDIITWLRHPLALGTKQPIKAAMLTSLGFGHVAGLIAVVHPGAFEQSLINSLGQTAAENWRKRANERLQIGRMNLELGYINKKQLFTPTEGRRFAEKSPNYDPHEVEANLLLDPNARLGENGLY